MGVSNDFIEIPCPRCTGLTIELVEDFLDGEINECSDEAWKVEAYRNEDAFLERLFKSIYDVVDRKKVPVPGLNQSNFSEYIEKKLLDVPETEKAFKYLDRRKKSNNEIGYELRILQDGNPLTIYLISCELTPDDHGQ